MAQELVLVPTEKYEILNKKREEAKTLSKTRECRDSNETSREQNIWEVLRYLVPTKLEKKAQGLLHYILHNGKNNVRWNDAGQLIYKGDTVDGSHVTDLVLDAITEDTSVIPIGYRQFYEALRDINTPTSLVLNKDRKHFLSDAHDQEGKGLIVKRKTDGAPPGFHNPRKRTMKWIKF